MGRPGDARRARRLIAAALLAAPLIAFGLVSSAWPHGDARACVTGISLTGVRAPARVVRGAGAVAAPSRLRAGDELHTRAAGAIRASGPRSRYRVSGWTTARVECRSGRPQLALVSGRIDVAAGAGAGLLTTSEAWIVAARAKTRFAVRRSRRWRRTAVVARHGLLGIATAALPRRGLRARATQVATIDRRGLRLDIYPFAVPADDRRPRRADALPRFWADGRRCSVGCRPRAAAAGWPLRPFHRQHALRAGLNELRPANFHLGIDIQAGDGAPVYAIQSGHAHVVAAAGVDERVRVGAYLYWHIAHRVREGQWVAAHRTVLGTVKHAFGHLHLSELDAAGRYLNPLRPGGRVLRPWADTEPPIVGAPAVAPDGRAWVSVFDPQSFVTTTTYKTPVIAPAAIAWRLFRGRRRIGPLRWALRGSQHLPDGLRRAVFAPGARSAGFTCFWRRRLCVPHWRYVLAGGLAPRIARFALGAGRAYRLVVYAWDWAGNVTARDAPLHAARVTQASSVRTPPWEPE